MLCMCLHRCRRMHDIFLVLVVRSIFICTFSVCSTGKLTASTHLFSSFLTTYPFHVTRLEFKRLISFPMGSAFDAVASPSRWRTSSPLPLRRLMSLCWADASILHSQWKRHSWWWLGAGRGLPWSTTICLGWRVLWCWAPGILQYVLVLFTHNPFMQCSVYNDASLVLGCVCVISLWEPLCAFFQSEAILAFLYFFKGLILG